MKAKKSFGQNWLKDEYTLGLIVDSAELNVADTVLEVGPGLGNLTQKLVQKAGRVVAVEADQDLVPQLKNKFGVNSRPGLEGDLRPGLELVLGDILKFDLSKMPKGFKVVANIPYYLTSNLIRNLLKAKNPPSLMVLLVQKEVAERIVASPGHMSVLAFSVQYYAKAEIVGPVAKELFEPVPKVDSAIIKIERLSKPAFEADTKQLFRLVKAGFGEKRKMLRNSLAGGLGISTSQTEDLLHQSGLQPTARAQELGVRQWQGLYQTALALHLL